MFLSKEILRAHGPLSAQEFSALMATLPLPHKMGTQHYAVAVSGGADSLALCLLLAQYVKEVKGHLTALTVDHGLRPESSQEAAQVTKILAEQSIPHHILFWQHKAVTSSIQEKARKARYDLLESWCYQHHVPYLFVAQHFDDQAETFFMRLMKKSSLIGLAGMRPVTRTQRCWIVRPFLTIHKQRLKETLRHMKVTWINDPSNENPAFERIFYRNLGATAAFPDSLNRCLLRTRTTLERWVQHWVQHYCIESDLGYSLLDYESLTQLPPFFRELILAYVLRAYGVGRYPPKTQVVQKLSAAVLQPNFKPSTAQGLRIAKIKTKEGVKLENRHGLLVHREYRAIKQGDQTRNFMPILWDERFLITLRLAETERLGPIGEQGWYQLLRAYPQLKVRPEPRPVLWALPGVWQDCILNLEKNMITQEFIHPKTSHFKKMFKFSIKYPF